MTEYERKEKENAERLAGQVEKHITTLKKLRDKLEDRQDLKSRTEEYRSWKQEFSSKKQAVLQGKVPENALSTWFSSNSSRDGGTGGSSVMSASSPSSSSSKQNVRSSSSAGKLTTPSGDSGNVSRGLNSSMHVPVQELSTVLDSLNKLAELEKRITSLEKDSAFDHLSSLAPLPDEEVAEFKKDRVGGAAPTANGYKLKMKKVPAAAWPSVKSMKPVSRGSSGGGINSAVRKRAALAAETAVKAQRRLAGNSSNGGGGVFLTGMGAEPDEEAAEYEDDFETSLNNRCVFV